MIGVATAVALAGAAVLAASLSAHTRAIAGWMVYALFAIIAAAFALFGWLVVDVDEREIRLRFGVGLVRRRIDMGAVERCERVRTRLWWGWGLHWTPFGWLYNVSGRDAVRLELRGERAVMIGSDDAVGLARAIEAARTQRKRETART